MRVTMLVRCLAMMHGGGETRHLAWMKDLAALGADVDVIAGRPLVLGGARYAVAWPHATVLRSPYLRDAVYRLQKRRGFGRVTTLALHADEEWFCRAAWRHIAARSNPPDIVHAHALHQAARLRRRGIPVVVNLPGPPHPRYTDDLRQADALVADGWAAANLPAMLGVPIQRVNKGVDADLFCPGGADRRAALGLGRKRVVVSVARLVPIKNVRLLVDAFRIIRAGDPGAHLLIVGEGPEARALEQQTVDAGVAKSVTFAGHVPHEETPEFYRSADVFALSSDFDNSPNVVLEAMASGLPVVATDVGGVHEFVDSEGGAIVPAGQPEALARAISWYLSNAAQARAAGDRNRAQALSRFSWRASACRLLEVYSDAIAARRAGERGPA
jgi:glycosyltransferase involved in cell wall biosynthesis